MQNLKLKESGKNWLRKAPAILLIVCCGIVGLICVISVLYASNSSNNDNGSLLAVIGLGIIALPFLPALLKDPVTIELMSQDGQLVIEKNHGVELRTQWSDIKSINSMSVMGAPKSIYFTYVDSEEKKKNYYLSTFYLKKEDVLAIARMIDENWTGKYGKANFLDV